VVVVVVVVGSVVTSAGVVEVGRLAAVAVAVAVVRVGPSTCPWFAAVGSSPPVVGPFGAVVEVVTGWRGSLGSVPWSGVPPADPDDGW